MKAGTLFDFLQGRLVVCADGNFTERLLNICMHRGMLVTEVKRCGTNRVIFTTDIKSFLKIRTPARRTRSRVRILKRRGLPFVIKRFSHRRSVAVGAVVIMLMLWYSSTHVIGITVFGNSRTDTAVIYKALEECGLSAGVRTREVEPDMIRNKMMNKLADLAWVGVNANGSRVYVEIVERIQKDEGIAEDGTVCNLVASADGEIEHTEVREGQIMVKKGYGVRKGDVLVSGIMDNGENGIRYVKARGEVYALTRRKMSRTYPLSYTEDVSTGNRRTRYKITVLGKSIPLYIGSKPPYDSFGIKEETKEYKTPVSALPSLFVSKAEYEEFYKENKTRTAKEAIETGIEELTQELMQALPQEAEVTEKKESHTLTEYGGVEVTVELICRENIAVPSVIETAESAE